MRVRITMEIQDDDYRTVETIPPVEALFHGVITEADSLVAQQLIAEALERHMRTHKAEKQ
jgi:hypothetical protein